MFLLPVLWLLILTLCARQFFKFGKPLSVPSGFIRSLFKQRTIRCNCFPILLSGLMKHDGYGE